MTDEEDFWWPSPEAFDDLEVVDIEGGFQLSGPDGTELAAWLNYWNETEERHEHFEAVFIAMLLDHIKTLELQNGERKITDECQTDREQA
jgi:hypothetical protein